MSGMDPREDLLKYWEGNRLTYEGGPMQELRSEFLVGLFKKYIPSSGRVLELGCNVGRNLWYLANAGYEDLHGIEINPKAILRGKAEGRDQISYHRGTLLDRLIVQEGPHSLPPFDVIFSMAVLMHIHPSEFARIVPLIALKARSYIITIESEVEKKDKKRNTGRDYRAVFEPYGFTQVERIKEVDGMLGAYIARVLKRD